MPRTHSTKTGTRSKKNIELENLKDILYLRGTAKFSLSLSKNLMTWTHAVSGVLPDVRGAPCEDRPEG